MTNSKNECKVLTLGCRLNAYESEIIRRNLKNSDVRNTVVINTCAVTAEAERQARQAVRRAKREYPEATIIVTGCAAQISPSTFGNMDEVDKVIGNVEKLKPDSYGKDREERIQVKNIMSIRKTGTHRVGDFKGRTRAFVQVQNGCDHRCTFCIIPFGRGNSRSVPTKNVISEVRDLTSRGYKEIILTGVDITSYGHDLPQQQTLGELVRSVIDAEPRLMRLRLSSLDPAAIDDELWTAIRDEPKLMPHIHLSIQAGNDLILKRMKRRHNRADIIDCCTRTRKLRHNITFGADLIAGFPTETETMFVQTLSLIKECDLSSLHVFPYSARDNTPASRMPRVPTRVRRERAARLRSMGIQVRTAVLKSQIGCEVEVLAEKIDCGKTENNIPVSFLSPQTPGEIVPIRLIRIDGNKLVGQPL